MVGVAAQAHRQAPEAHFQDAAQGVAGAFRRVDAFAHLRRRVLVGGSQVALLDGVQVVPVEAFLRLDAAQRDHVVRTLHAEFAQQLERHAADRHPRRRLAGAGALQHVAQILVAVFDAAAQVGVTGPGVGQRLLARLPARFRRHDLGPVTVVLVDDHQRDRGSGGAPGPDTRDDLRLVRLDHHAPPAPVTALTPAQPGIDVTLLQSQLRRQPLDDGRELRPVRFTGGQKSHPRTLMSPMLAAARTSRPRPG